MGISVMNQPVEKEETGAVNRPHILGSQMTTHAIINVPLDGGDDTASWAQLAVSVFARDWDSDEDAAYDDVQQG